MGDSFYTSLSTPYLFLAGMHKVHPAYRMVNAWRAGWRLERGIATDSGKISYAFFNLDRSLSWYF
jgi:hypothetical protein